MPDWIDQYRSMVTIRLFEERVNELYRSARMPGLAHLYIGEEAVAVGVCAALRREDYITSTHRGHGHCLAKGADIGRTFAELLGKEAGYCRGKGGSMHIADHQNGNLGANAIVGGSTGIATGAAFSAARRGTDQVAVCFFGEGALGQGLLYEVMNMASLWKLPVVYVCENNLYNEYTHYAETTAGDVLDRPRAFGITADEVDGQDVRAVYQATAEMVASARSGGGPASSCATPTATTATTSATSTASTTGAPRRSSSGGRSATRSSGWPGGCAARVRPMPSSMLPSRRCGSASRAALRSRWRRRSPTRKRWTRMSTSSPQAGVVTRELTFGQAINEALAEELRRDERVFVIGEDVAEAGTPFKVLSGLVAEFGPERVIDSPISEAGITGLAVGAAMTGMRPVVDIMFGDFLTLVMDQLVNQAAKAHYMSGGSLRVPLVLRTTLGATRRSAAQHSQSLQAWVSHIPGLKVAIPSTPADAKGLLKTAIRDDNPVVFIEDKLHYPLKGEVPDGEHLIPFGVADVKRRGTDVTIIATSSMVQASLAAAELLAARGIDAGVIDPRTTRPLDEETIVAAVECTGRAVVVDEGHRSYGVTAEIAATIAEHCFYHLDAPVRRLGARDVPVPFSPPLEDVTVPTPETIAATVDDLVAGR